MARRKNVPWYERPNNGLKVNRIAWLDVSCDCHGQYSGSREVVEDVPDGLASHIAYKRTIHPGYTAVEIARPAGTPAYL